MAEEKDQVESTEQQGQQQTEEQETPLKDRIAVDDRGCGHTAQEGQSYDPARCDR